MTFGPGSTYGDEGAGAATSYMVLTWIGIAVMVAVLVYWVIWENRRLMAFTPDGTGDPAQVRARNPMDEHNRYPKFPPLQTHSRKFELVMLGLSIACMIIVLAIILFTDLGTEFRPKV